MHLGVLQKKVILSVNSRVIFPDVVSELIIGRNFFTLPNTMVLYVVKIYLIYLNSCMSLAWKTLILKITSPWDTRAVRKYGKITKFLVLRIRSHLTVYSSHFWSLIVTKYFRRNYPEHCAHDRLGEILKTF